MALLLKRINGHRRGFQRICSKAFFVEHFVFGKLNLNCLFNVLLNLCIFVKIRASFLINLNDNILKYS